MRLLRLDDVVTSYTHARHIAIPEKPVFRLASRLIANWLFGDSHLAKIPFIKPYRLRFLRQSHYASRMRLLLTATLLLAVITPCANASSDPVSTQIVVRVLNGKDGKPIKHKTLGVRVGSAVQKNYRTNDHGEVVIIVTDLQAKIEVWLTDFYIDCETYGNGDGQLTRFSLDGIASKGVVAENRCGTDRADPMPGVLIVYKRKMTREERRAI